MTPLVDWSDPPPRGWTTDDLDRLTGCDRRHELIDGVIPLGPPPGPAHQRVVDLLGARLEAGCPPRYELKRGYEIRFSSRRSFLPDLQVVLADPGGRRGSWVPPREVVVAIEVVAPTSLVMDRITKPAVYAAAGIPYYWRVETDGGVEVCTYRLDPVDERYRDTGAFRAVLDVAEPWPIRIPVEAITP
jgi:Uma2 family endonuclease